jgi:NADH:ubiquinone oxidoreductase subunit 4 (subunit M)
VSIAVLVLAGLFLPLFPLSMLFNRLFARVGSPLWRGLLLLAWPQVGLALLRLADAPVPDWLVAWGLFTAALYALRALALREVGLWTAFLATSAWALLWVPLQAGTGSMLPQLHALSFSLPLVLLVLLAAGLERRFGAAYTGLYGGLAQALPRFAGVLVVVVLAVIATPVFPSFLTMLAAVLAATPAGAVALAGIWLLWSWAGMRLLQGLVVGPLQAGEVPDLGPAATWAYVAALGALVVAGLGFGGGLP